MASERKKLSEENSLLWMKARVILSQFLRAYFIIFQSSFLFYWNWLKRNFAKNFKAILPRVTKYINVSDKELKSSFPVNRLGTFSSRTTQKNYSFIQTGSVFLVVHPSWVFFCQCLSHLDFQIKQQWSRFLFCCRISGIYSSIRGDNEKFLAWPTFEKIANLMFGHWNIDFWRVNWAESI